MKVKEIAPHNGNPETAAVPVKPKKKSFFDAEY